MQRRTPPKLAEFAKQFCCRLGHRCPVSENVSCEKNSESHPDNLQLAGLQLPQKHSTLGVRFGRGGYQTHFPSSCRAGKHQNATKSRTGFWRCRLSPLPSSKPLSAIRIVTYHGALGAPCQSRLTEVMKNLMTIALLYIILKYNSDRDGLAQTSTSLITTTLRRSPPG